MRQRIELVEVFLEIVLFTAIGKVIKQRDAVGLGPDSNLSGVFKRLVIPFQRFLAIKRYREVSGLKIDSKRMPLVRSNLYPRPLSLGAAPVNRIVDGDVVFQGIGAGDIVIVRIPGTPDQAARLIFLSGNGLEFDFDEAILQVRVFFDSHGICRLTRLLEHVRLARGTVVLFHGPFRLACSGLCRSPSGRRFARLESIEINCLG